MVKGPLMRLILQMNVLLIALSGCGAGDRSAQDTAEAKSPQSGQILSAPAQNQPSAHDTDPSNHPGSGNNSNPNTSGSDSSKASGSGTDLNGDKEIAARSFRLPAPVEKTTSGALWATFYHTLRFQNLEMGLPLLAMNGSELGPRLSKLQWCQAAMEGSVQIFYQGSWRTYNYAGTGGSVQVDCSEYYDHPVGRTRFTIARGPFGDGVRNYILVPFRTIAVDPAVFPYGTVLYIDSARGLPFTLNDGTEYIHDGYFFAGDTGGLIHDNHIDVFIGNALRSPFPWITSNSKSRIGYQVVTDSGIRDTLTKLHIYAPN